MESTDNTVTGRRRRRDHDRRLKAEFEQLLVIEFDVLFDIDIELDEDSVRIRLVDGLFNDND